MQLEQMGIHSCGMLQSILYHYYRLVIIVELRALWLLPVPPYVTLLPQKVEFWDGEKITCYSDANPPADEYVWTVKSAVLPDFVPVTIKELGKF